MDDTAGGAANRSTRDWPQVLERVAGRLRDLRHRRCLTLAQVAEATGIHVSTLSRLESGARRPGLDLLLPLAEVYGVPLDHLVGATSAGDPRVHPRPVHTQDMVYIPLSRRGGGTQAYKLILPGLDAGRRMRLRTHNGTEWMYVLAGRVSLQIGQETTELGAGEAAEFGCHTPHGIWSATAEPSEVLALFNPQGEQIHLGGG